MMPLPMALSATIFTFDISLSDMDRGVYATLPLKIAQHPAESVDYMLTRVLAYCLEYTDALQPFLEFGRSVGTVGGAEPAVWAKDYTGAIKLWVEVGLPDFDKLHRAAKLAERVAVYTHRDPLQLIRALAGRGLFRGAEIPLISFDRAFLAQLAERIGRRAAIDLSVTEQSLYVHIDGHSIEGRMDVKQGLE